MSKSPDHKTGNGEYNGGAPIVLQSELLTGVTTASQTSVNKIAPFDFKVKEAFFRITDTLASDVHAKLKVNGTVVADLNLNGLAAGAQDMKTGATTTWAAANYAVAKGDLINWTLGNLASVAGHGVIVGNPQ